MKRLFLTFLFLLFLPSVAWGGDLYVSATATGDLSGSDTSNFCTLATANANLSAGETAYLYDDGGTIVGRIEPANNGTSGNLITYEEATGETVVLSPSDTLDGNDQRSCIAIIGSSGNEKSYIKVKGVTTRSENTNNGQRFFNIYWANNITFENCLFETPTFTGGITIGDFHYALSGLYDSSYIQFLTCEWNATTTPLPAADDDANDTQNDLLNGERVSHSLWKDCTFGDVSHTPIRLRGHVVGDTWTDITDWDFNAIIDCTFTNKWRRSFEIIQRTEWQAFPQGWLFDGNTFANVGVSNAECPTWDDRNRGSHNKMHGQWLIFRENVAYGSNTGLIIGGGPKEGDTTPKYNYVYHNTWYDTAYPTSETVGGASWYTETIKFGLEDNTIINNIFWEYDYDLQVMISTSTGDLTGNTITYNSFGKAGPITKIRWGGTTYTSLTTLEAAESQWANNILADPDFTDPANQDFTLQQGSSCIDAGTHLTLTDGTGDGTTKVVTLDNAWPFFSGPNSPWFLSGTTADTIYIEDTGAVTIDTINYSTNQVTLTANATWGDNKKVFYCVNGNCYAGTGSDIGANEYECEPGNSPPTGTIFPGDVTIYHTP